MLSKSMSYWVSEEHPIVLTIYAFNAAHYNLNHDRSLSVSAERSGNAVCSSLRRMFLADVPCYGSS